MHVASIIVHVLMSYVTAILFTAQCFSVIAAVADDSVLWSSLADKELCVASMHKPDV